jgi:hypothetical protein
MFFLISLPWYNNGKMKTPLLVNNLMGKQCTDRVSWIENLLIKKSFNKHGAGQLHDTRSHFMKQSAKPAPNRQDSTVLLRLFLQIHNHDWTFSLFEFIDNSKYISAGFSLICFSHNIELDIELLSGLYFAGGSKNRSAKGAYFRRCWISSFSKLWMIGMACWAASSTCEWGMTSEKVTSYFDWSKYDPVSCYVPLNDSHTGFGTTPLESLVRAAQYVSISPIIIDLCQRCKLRTAKIRLHVDWITSVIEHNKIYWLTNVVTARQTTSRDLDYWIRANYIN